MQDYFLNLNNPQFTKSGLAVFAVQMQQHWEIEF